MTWLGHVKRARARVQDLGGKFFALGRRKWGNSKRVLKAIFERVISPMVLYGSEIWGERAWDSRVARQLGAIERPYLRGITRAYRTAPTAALSVLSGCVPLVVQARARHESRVNWGGRIRRVGVRERPHPAIRGCMPSIREGENERVRIWVDATVKENGLKAIALVISVRGEMEKGGTKVEGEIGNTELEAWAVYKGILKGMEVRVNERAISVTTDSKGVVSQIKDQNTRWWVTGKVQMEIARAWENGIRIEVVWKTRMNDVVRLADRECKRIIGMEGESERVDGVSKSAVNKWRREWEMREWQRNWDEGTTGRWMYELWKNVNRKGAEISAELTQVATEHGNLRAYLGRFRLNEGESEECECGIGRENARHIVNNCLLGRRVEARRKLQRDLGHYPPRLDEVSGEGWMKVLDWANELINE